MGICWYCHWGWSRPVVEIYQRAIRALDGDDMPLHYGPAHIVWEDENFGRSSVEYCLDHAQEHRGDLSDREVDVVVQSLRELLALPDEVRDPEPADYDDANPEAYPPAIETMNPREAISEVKT